MAQNNIIRDGLPMYDEWIWPNTKWISPHAGTTDRLISIRTSASILKYTLCCAFLVSLLSGCAFLLPAPKVTFRDSKLPARYLRGVFHVHSTFSKDSRASLNRVIKLANNAGLDFVIVTDHNTLAGRDVYHSMNPPDIPLLIFGNEITTVDGHLIALGVHKEPEHEIDDTQELVHWIHSNGGFAVIAHPLSSKRPWTNWELQDLDGIEVYNFGHALYKTNKLKLVTSSLLLGPTPFLNTNLDSPHHTLRFWDSLLSAPTRRLVATAATDAHLKLADVPIMRGLFRQAIRSVTLYVQADRLNEGDILRNLMEGNSFIVFESLGTAHDFSFNAVAPAQSYNLGAAIPPHLTTTFSVIANNADEIRLIRDGHLVKQTHSETLRYSSKEPGAYRVEAYRKKKIWIISNPIYKSSVKPI